MSERDREMTSSAPEDRERDSLRGAAATARMRADFFRLKAERRRQERDRFRAELERVEAERDQLRARVAELEREKSRLEELVGVERERHAIKRAWQRYGLRLTRADLIELCQRVHAGDGERRYSGRGCYRVRLRARDRDMLLVWSKPKNMIVTFLTDEKVSDAGERAPEKESG